MALPSSKDIQTIDWSYQGQPFVNVPGNSTVVTTTMDWSYQGQPFVTNPSVAAGPANLKTWCGVSAANIKTINGIPIANIKSINGIL